MFAGVKANSIQELAEKIGLDAKTLCHTVEEFNQACVQGTFNHTVLDDCTTENIVPNKTHWAAQENGLKIAFLTDQEKDELRQKYQ